MRRLAAVLVHFPVLDRQGGIVTSAITNLDLHDIARSARTYGLDAYYVVHPVQAQRELASRVRNHWVEGSGGRRIPDRSPALQLIEILESLDAAIDHFGRGEPVELWVTSAKAPAGSALSFAGARERLREPGAPVLLAFGTGWGLAPEVMARAAQYVEPIASAAGDGYNHLSVRAAAAIMFDRLLGQRA